MQEATILDEEIIREIQKMAEDWTQRIVNQLHAYVPDFRTNPAVFLGGGSLLLKPQIEKSKDFKYIEFIEDVRANAIREYLKSQKRCKTALITELVYAWLHKENGVVSSYNNVNVSVEELKQQLLQDKGFLQQIRESVNIEVDSEKIQQEEKEDGLDMDEGMMMAGLSMFENSL